MNALDVYTKRNIYDYLARLEEKYDKEYSKERQEIKKYISEDDRKKNGRRDWLGIFTKRCWWLEIENRNQWTKRVVKMKYNCSKTTIYMKGLLFKRHLLDLL